MEGGNFSSVQLGKLKEGTGLRTCYPLESMGSPARQVKHHYLPEFYLKRWAAPDGLLWQFSRPQTALVANRRAPAQTGFLPGLYELPGASPEEAQAIERGFMQLVDSKAAEAMVLLEQRDRRMQEDASLRSAWTRFVMSLLMRTPEAIATFKRGYAEEWARISKRSRDRDSVERDALKLAIDLMVHPDVAGLLDRMYWAVLTPPAGQFMTSDRPVYMTETLSEDDAFYFIPLNPRQALLATREESTLRKFAQVELSQRVDGMNSLVVAQAERFVYGSSDESQSFVAEHMGTRRRPTILERLVIRRLASPPAGT
jgi:hypothetical protein